VGEDGEALDDDKDQMALILNLLGRQDEQDLAFITNKAALEYVENLQKDNTADQQLDFG